MISLTPSFLTSSSKILTLAPSLSFSQTAPGPWHLFLPLLELIFPTFCRTGFLSSFQVSTLPTQHDPLPVVIYFTSFRAVIMIYSHVIYLSSPLECETYGCLVGTHAIDGALHSGSGTHGPCIYGDNKQHNITYIQKLINCHEGKELGSKRKIKRH